MKTSTVKPATTKPSQPVDLEAFDELVMAAMEAGVEKTAEGWARLRDWAEQSDAHRDKACNKLARAMDEVAE